MRINQSEIIGKDARFWEKTLGFWVVMLIFWSLLGWALIQWGYYGSFIKINPHDSNVLDLANMYFFTHLGEGVILPGILILLIWREDPALALSGIIAILFTGLVCQILKHGPFDAWDRPPLVFQNMEGLSFPEKKKLLHHSFPSGHSTSMAAGGMFFAVYFSRFHKILPYLVGIFTSYLCLTRTMLGVHFPGDLFAGSFLGAIGALFIYRYVYPKLSQKLNPQILNRTPAVSKVAIGLAILGIIGQYSYLIGSRLAL